MPRACQRQWAAGQQRRRCKAPFQPCARQPPARTTTGAANGPLKAAAVSVASLLIAAPALAGVVLEQPQLKKVCTGADDASGGSGGAPVDSSGGIAAPKSGHRARAARRLCAAAVSAFLHGRRAGGVRRHAHQFCRTFGKPHLQTQPPAPRRSSRTTAPARRAPPPRRPRAPRRRRSLRRWRRARAASRRSRSRCRVRALAFGAGGRTGAGAGALAGAPSGRRALCLRGGASLDKASKTHCTAPQSAPSLLLTHTLHPLSLHSPPPPAHQQPKTAALLFVGGGAFALNSVDAGFGEFMRTAAVKVRRWRRR